MLWATLITATVGVLLGLRLRVPALLAASAVTAVLAILHAVAVGLSWLAGAAQIVAWLAGLQAGYLVGLWMAHGWARFTVAGHTSGPTIRPDQEAGKGAGRSAL